jgi:hypothetical protein
VAGRGRDQRIADDQDASSDHPEQPVPVLQDDQVRGLLAACSGKDFRDRRYAAIIRLFVDTGCGSRAWADWGTAPTIPIGLTGPAITSRAHHREGPT